MKWKCAKSYFKIINTIDRYRNKSPLWVWCTQLTSSTLENIKLFRFFSFFHSREFRMKTTSDRYMACKVISIYIYIGMHLCVLNEMFVTFSVAMPQMNAWDSFTHKSNAIKRIKWKEKMLPTGKLNRIFLFFNSSNNNNKKSISYSIRVFDLQFTSRINVWLCCTHVDFMKQLIPIPILMH